jgi:hypothetical protein
MFYLIFLIFSLGAAMLQSSYLRAPKGIVPTRRRVTYTVIAAIATCIQVLVGCFRIDPTFIGALIFIPIFYIVNKGLQSISLRLRYTFRIGLLLVLLTGYPLIHDTWKVLGLSF